MNRPTPDRRRGIALMLGAGLCWSSGGLIVRSLSVSNVWEIVFWRALFMALFVAAVLIALHRRAAWSQVRAIGPAGAVSAFFLAAQIYLFILALRHTSTANTFVLMSLSPLVTALAGRLFLGERVAWTTWAAITIALAGIAVMFGAGLGAVPAHSQLIGNLFALCVPLAYTCQILAVRRVRGAAGAAPNLMPTILVAGLIALVPAWWLAPALTAGMRDITLLALMGSIQLGLGCLLMTLAVPHLRAAEMGLLALIETILAPFWVWIGIGETPGAAAVAGGSMIIAALLANGILGLRDQSANAAHRAPDRRA